LAAAVAAVVSVETSAAGETVASAERTVVAVEETVASVVVVEETVADVVELVELKVDPVEVSYYCCYY
jgi:hypothetical protein